MVWQDWVFTLGQFIFVIALIPTIKGNDKPAFLTSSITAAILFSFAITYLTLELWGSAIFAFLNSSAWAILAVQKYLINEESRS